MGYLTTHILDTTQGIAATEVEIRLFRVQSDHTKSLLNTFISNHDGRCDEPLLEGDDFEIGTYELEFDIAEYFNKQGIEQSTPSFLSTVVIRFGISDKAAHYHIPLLVSPYSYSTYRGS